MTRPILLLSLAATLMAPPILSQTDSAQGYGAWFGSIPDLNDSGKGVLLEGTSPGSPAAKAGLRKGDLITMMAGDTVGGLRDMVEVLREHAPGETIEVVYQRDGKAHKAKVTLGVRPGR
jgi:putative serine protease PepD